MELWCPSLSLSLAGRNWLNETRCEGTSPQHDVLHGDGQEAVVTSCNYPSCCVNNWADHEPPPPSSGPLPLLYASHFSRSKVPQTIWTNLNPLPILTYFLDRIQFFLDGFVSWRPLQVSDGRNIALYARKVGPNKASQLVDSWSGLLSNFLCLLRPHPHGCSFSGRGPFMTPSVFRLYSVEW